jgi:hypothetical protein
MACTCSKVNAAGFCAYCGKQKRKRTLASMVGEEVTVTMEPASDEDMADIAKALGIPDVPPPTWPNPFLAILNATPVAPVASIEAGSFIIADGPTCWIERDTPSIPDQIASLNLPDRQSLFDTLAELFPEDMQRAIKSKVAADVAWLRSRAEREDKKKEARNYVVTTTLGESEERVKAVAEAMKR